MPASARTSPLPGRITAIPPSRPASAVTAAACSSRSIDVRTSAPFIGSTEARTRSPARSLPPGRPVELDVELALEAREPDRGVERDAAPAQLGGALGRGRADGADDVGRGGPAAPVRAAPSASTVPSRGLQRGALRDPGGAVQLLALAQAGEDEVRLPLHLGALLVVDCIGERERSDDSVPNTRVRTVIGTRTTPSASGSAGRPGVMPESVLTAAARR